MVGPQCCDNAPTLSPASGVDHVEELGGLNTYVSGLPDVKKAILLISDVFGYEAPNLRKLADKIASAGYYVVVPDFLHGDPYDLSNSERPILVWIEDHGMDKGFEDAKLVIEALRTKGINAVGAAGFCWGGKVVVDLAKHGHIEAAVLCHPSQVTVDDIKAVKTPIAILGAETDSLAPPELVLEYEEVLKSKPEVESFVKIFPGVVHGWTTRFDAEDAVAVKAAEEAQGDMLDWFGKFIK